METNPNLYRTLILGGIARLPQSPEEARAFVAARNREARERRAADKAAHERLLSEIRDMTASAKRHTRAAAHGPRPAAAGRDHGWPPAFDKARPRSFNQLANDYYEGLAASTASLIATTPRGGQ